MNRRGYLALAARSIASLAGCSESDPGAVTTTSSSDETQSPTPTDQPTTTKSPTTTEVDPEDYDPKQVREEAQTLSYDELFRNFEDYKGDAVYFEFMYVYQAIYEDEYTYVQANVSNTEESYQGDIAAWYFGDERILEGDVMEMWGVAEELWEYETVQGDTRTIPGIVLVDYELYDDDSGGP